MSSPPEPPSPKLTLHARPADTEPMAGYLIGSIAFLVALALGATGLGRPRLVLAVGALAGCAWIAGGAIARADDLQKGNDIVPLWFLAALVGFLYLIWCGGLWLGLRLRRARASG